MRRISTIAILAATLFPASLAGQPPAQCGLNRLAVHTSFDGPRSIYGGSNGMFFTTNMAVNTDGASTSYHPDDPAGRNGLAINTICNGANARLVNGTVLDYRRCGELLAAFREAKASGWATTGAPQINFYAVATKQKKPCIVATGPNAGYFVSTTSLLADAGRDVCDPARYLDSLKIPFSISPGNSVLQSNGVGLGSVVVSYNPATKIVEFGLVGDRGPKRGLAEGSVFLARTLGAKTTDPHSQKESYAFAVPKMHTLMLPNTKIKPPYTLENIRAQAKTAFAAWGGQARFDACVGAIGKPN